MEGSVGQRFFAVEDASPREVLVLGRWPGWLHLLRTIFMIALAAAVLFSGFFISNRLIAAAEKPQSRAPVERSFPVDAIIAKRESVSPTIISYGDVVAGRTVDLRALVAGEVISVSPHLIDGGKVDRGEVLLQVDPFNYRSALVRAETDKAESIAREAETRARIGSERAALTRAEEQLALAEREIERFESLRRSGAASNAQLDAARLRQSTAAAAVDQRQNAILVLDAQAKREAAPLRRLEAAIAQAERDIVNTTLRAPFSGIVSNAGAEIGKLLNPNDRVATLVSAEALDVRFSLGDAQFGRLAGDGAPLEGRKITAIWRSGGAEFKRSGTISRVAPLTDAREGGLGIFARLDDGGDAASIWRPGVFVEVQLEDKRFADVLRLPQSAVFPGGIIYRIGADKRLVETKVETLGFDGEMVLLKADVPDGAALLATRLSEAGPGVLVSPRAEAGTTPKEASSKP
jgi:membrane fusion protein, multidrug efflux system